MDERRITFHDGYWYCYANSAAMLLSSIGEDISPRLIEALSGVGLGAFFAPAPLSDGGLPFFSGLAGTPDTGVTRALRLLGFDVEVAALQSSPAPFDMLAAVLTTGPAVLGPLDMSALTYNPSRPSRPGVDHYVLADRIEAGDLVVYDPAGFAEAVISKAELEEAWRADTIGYKAAAYQYWTAPRRLSRPTASDIAAAAVAEYQCLYRDADRLAAETGWLTDATAIDHLAGMAGTSALTPAISGHLLQFALPLGTKRALDFATFFEPIDPALTSLKRQQAVLFGRCHSALARGALLQVADGLSRLAGLETSIRNAVEGL
jgi:hypothetical protein